MDIINDCNPTMFIPMILRYIKRFVLLSSTIFCIGISFAQDLTMLTKLKQEMESMNNDPLFKYGQIGFSLRADNGQVIYDYNGDKSLVPASNLKLLTTATALKILGKDFRFETKLYHDGVVVDGALKGNIYIVGGGDPTLGAGRIRGNPGLDELFSDWSKKIKQSGITTIQGSIIPIASIFETNTIPGGWIWTDIGNYYGAGISGLNINENLYKLVFKPGRSVGDYTEIIRTEPSIPQLRFNNQVKTGAAGSGDNAYIYGGPFTYHKYVEGTIPAGVSAFSIKGAIPDPPMFCAYLLYDYLQKQEISVEQVPVQNQQTQTGVLPASCKLITTHYSADLESIIRYTNYYSINLYAEALLKMIALKEGESSSFKKGIQKMKDYWQSQTVDTEGMFLYDGSGLSPQTAIRPSQVTHILHLMSADSVFYKSLPVAGVSGTIGRFCKGTKAENRISAKSGTLAKVIGYSGYVQAKNEKRYSFSVFINNYNGSYSSVVARLEKIMIILSDL